MPPPHPAPSGPGGTHTSCDGTLAPPPSLTPWPPPSAPLDRLQSAHPASSYHRHAAWAPRQPSPEEESSFPRTSDSTSHTTCFADLLQHPRSCSRPRPAHPGSPSPSETL